MPRETLCQLGRRKVDLTSPEGKTKLNQRLPRNPKIIPSFTSPEGQNQTIPTSPEYQNHTIFTSPEGQNQTIPTSPEYQNHTILTSPEYQNHAIVASLIFEPSEDVVHKHFISYVFYRGPVYHTI